MVNQAGEDTEDGPGLVLHIYSREGIKGKGRNEGKKYLVVY